ncbi:MAG: zinc dependent phospholipase C family protein [Nitrospirae bacterium]|nr:zinc dependent phospholipase C family protein [Nitrospirota bacterium]
MKIQKIILVLYFVLVPSVVFAWGPLTHIYLGNELFLLSPLLPAGLMNIIRRYRKDFLYGNLMADIIIGKKYLPENRSSHSWDVAFELFREAGNDQQKAFVYGYMGHLAADTVAHNTFTADRKNIGHTVMEMKADCIIDKKYWIQAVGIDRKIQARNDMFLENSLDRLVFSFKTNKRIFKGMVLMSVINQKKIGAFIDTNLITTLPSRETIEDLHLDSLDRMIDLFENWENSEVVGMNPSGVIHRGRLTQAFLSEVSAYRRKKAS